MQVPFITNYLLWSLLHTDPARVVYSPTIQYLPLGLSGIVRCFIQASPPFQLVTWTKDRRPFDPNSTPGVITLNNGSLQFNRVSHEHQGIYRCTAYNIHGASEPSQGMEVLVRGRLALLLSRTFDKMKSNPSFIECILNRVTVIKPIDWIFIESTRKIH